MPDLSDDDSVCCPNPNDAMMADIGPVGSLSRAWSQLHSSFGLVDTALIIQDTCMLTLGSGQIVSIEDPSALNISCFRMCRLRTQ